MASWQGGDAISFFSSRLPDGAEKELVAGTRPVDSEHCMPCSDHRRARGNEARLPVHRTAIEGLRGERGRGRGGWPLRTAMELMARGHWRRRRMGGEARRGLVVCLEVEKEGEEAGAARI